MVSKDKAIPINELLYYRIEKDSVHIQIVPEKEVKNVMDRFMEGLSELAKIVKEKNNIKEIIIHSWMVAEYPMVLERFGFEVDGEISADLKNKYFSEEKRPIWEAHMDRDEFVNRYLD